MIKKSQLNNTFGHDREHWANAKEEARRVLSDIAVTSKLIEYGELTKRIQSIRFEPHGDDFRRFLGQLSREPDATGLGMITAIVVHKGRPTPPATGFSL